MQKYNNTTMQTHTQTRFHSDKAAEDSEIN